MLDKEDKEILSEAFISALSKFREMNKPPSDLDTHRYQGTPMNSTSTKLVYQIPVGRSEYTTDKNADLVGTHLTSANLATPIPEPAGLTGMFLNEDGSITFKFRSKTKFPIAYALQFVK